MTATKVRCPACGDTYDARATWVREAAPICYRCQTHRRETPTTTTKPKPFDRNGIVVDDDAFRMTLDDDAFAEEHVLLYMKARDEVTARRVAREAGKTKTPPMKYWTELTRRQAAMTTNRTASKDADTKTGGTARTDIVYYHDGKAMPGSHAHKLSTLAYFHSGGIASASSPRQSTKDFKQTLKKLGVDDPGQPGWMVTLPNGKVIECRKVGETPKAKPVTNGAAKKATRSTTKSTAKKATAAKPAAIVEPNRRDRTIAAKAVAATKSAEKPLTQGQVAFREGKAARASKAAAKKESGGPAPKKATAKRTTKATTSSARAKAGVKPTPKKAAGKATAARKSA